MVEISISKNGVDIQPSSAREYYPFYLTQHKNKTNRRLHFIGTSVGTLLLASAAVTGDLRLIPAGLVTGYGLAWIGHFFVEKNKPATFKQPLYSFICDYYMWWDIARGKIKF